MKRIITLFGIVGIAAMAMAMTTFSKVFHETYDIKKGSSLDKLNCAVCHVGAKGGKVLNAYGKDIQVVMKAANTKKLTKELLAKVEDKDSDKDGVKNEDEIKKDRNPGVADK